MSVLRPLYGVIRKKKSEIYRIIALGSCFTIMRSLRDFFTKNFNHVVSEPSYSPDLVPRDFFLFPKLKDRSGDSTQLIV